MKKMIAGFGIFLIFMAACTLISKSVYAYRLPMVTTLCPESKYVEHTVEAEGLVIAGGEKPVTYLPGFRIASMPVRVGDRIEEGDVLFRIDLEDLEEMMTKKEEEISKISLQINTILENQAIAEQKKELELARAREDYDTTARIQDTQVGRALENYVQAENELEEDLNGEDKEQKSALQNAAYGEADAKAARDEAVKQAERRVEDILLPENASSDLDSAQMELSGLFAERKELQQIKDGQGIVTAPFGGVITQILVGTGGRIPDTAVMLISDESLPCQLKVTLDKEQKKYISPGDSISVKLEGQSGELEEKVAYLAESREAAEKYEALVELPKEMGTPGVSGSISRKEQGEKYRLCLPPAALHESEKQYYVYVLKQREGILGEEYYVDMVNVKVLDKNDSWAAVEEGVLDGESRIIVSSTKEIRKGETVRWESS